VIIARAGLGLEHELAAEERVEVHVAVDGKVPHTLLAA
jgi:hypothetical protein